jgi:hypothetical protein
MEKDFFEELDKILSGVPDSGGVFELKKSKLNPQSLGKQLEKDGYGEYIGSNSFRVFPEGVDFYKMGGYADVYERRLLEEKKLTSEVEYNERANKALKREPYLIAWAVTTTLITIVLYVISLLKK